MSWELDGRKLDAALVTRLRYLGDVVMSTVVLEVLRAGDPTLRLGFLCEQEHAPVLDGHPLLDRVHRLRTARRGRDAAARSGKSPAGDPAAGPARGALGTIGELRRFRYDLALDLFFNPRSAWLLRLSGIPRRVGGTLGSRRFLYSHSVVRRQVIREYPGFDAVAPGGLGDHLCRLAPLRHRPSGLAFPRWLLENYRPGQLRPRLAGTGRDGAHPRKRSTLLLAPGATWASKQWPQNRWRELVDRLLQDTDLALAVLVPPGKSAEWAPLAGVVPGDRGGLLPEMALPEVIAALEQARLVISVDGGVMHTAVGLGIPTLALFGPTDPAVWFPYEKAGPFRVLCTRPACHPCHLHQCGAFVCLPDLTADQVAGAAMELLDAGGEPRAIGGG